ncbi:MAG TPA: MCE family protein [Actinomycetota bacterium]|nr:MCE family protein [Actinomycetota bacterium]
MSIRNFRERNPVLIGIISIATITILTTLSFSIDKLPAIKKAYDIQAEFADAAGLQVENQVRVAGIKVGSISKVELAGDRVLVTMEIENHVELPDATSAEIKLATLLGTKYVALEAAGGDPLLEEGDVIPLARTKVPYEIYQAANQGTAIVEEIDGDALNALLVELTKLTKEAQGEVGIALEGLNELGAGLNDKEDDLNALLVGADDLTEFLSDEGDDIIRLIDASNDILGTLAAKREEIQSLLESTKFMAGELGNLVKDHRSELDSIFLKLHRALLVLDRNIEHIDVALEYAGRSSRYFGSILQQGPWADIFTCVTVVTAGCEQDE